MKKQDSRNRWSL